MILLINTFDETILIMILPLSPMCPKEALIKNCTYSTINYIDLKSSVKR